LWKEIQTVLEGAVKDTSSKEAKSLSVAFYRLQVNQELKDYQIAGLESALKVRKKQKKKSTILDLQQRKEYHGSAVFYSPGKIREAQFRELTKQQEDEQEKARKAERKENRTAAARY
jgi:3-mercaptopyruvate sulfurtransferase SseA